MRDLANIILLSIGFSLLFYAASDKARQKDCQHNSCELIPKVTSK